MSREHWGSGRRLSWHLDALRWPMLLLQAFLQPPQSCEGNAVLGLLTPFEPVLLSRSLLLRRWLIRKRRSDTDPLLVVFPGLQTHRKQAGPSDFPAFSRVVALL